MSVPVPGEPRRLYDMPTKGCVVVAHTSSAAAAIKGARENGCDYYLSPWPEAGQVFWIDIDAGLNAMTGGPDGAE